MLESLFDLKAYRDREIDPRGSKGDMAKKKGSVF